MADDIGPGTLVECVDDHWRRGINRWVKHRPVAGRIYTVRSVDDGPPPHLLPGLWLVEIVNPPRQWANGFLEASFRITRFRPVRDDAIDIFRRLAEPTDAPETADA